MKFINKNKTGMSTAASAVLLIALIAVIAAGAYAVLNNNDNASYNVSYELNGGTCDPANPSVVSADTEGNLVSPVKTLFIFNGWYSDSSFSDDSKINGFSDIKSDMTLYADWNSLVGNTYVYSMTSSADSDSVFSITGDLELTYSASKDDNYLMVDESRINLDIMGLTIRNASFDSYWTENGDFDDYIYAGTEEIDTYEGLKNLNVYESLSEGDRLYVDSDWTIYKMMAVESDEESNYNTILMLESVTSFTPKDSYTVTVHNESDVTSYGQGTYDSGEPVTLGPALGSIIGGWYTYDGAMYSGESVFTIDAIGSDFEVYSYDPTS